VKTSHSGEDPGVRGDDVFKTVAVVDDDRNMLKATERLLTVHGFAAEKFASAEAFLDSGAVDEVQCLVLDIRLRGMSGIELQRLLKIRNRTLPVIFITGTDDRGTREEALAAGCVAYLQKPFSADELICALRSVC
jgi:FixJ family two-component response regulator